MRERGGTALVPDRYQIKKPAPHRAVSNVAAPQDRQGLAEHERRMWFGRVMAVSSQFAKPVVDVEYSLECCLNVPNHLVHAHTCAPSLVTQQPMLTVMLDWFGWFRQQMLGKTLLSCRISFQSLRVFTAPPMLCGRRKRLMPVGGINLALYYIRYIINRALVAAKR
jgi:hypothetical protein